jgi:crotonobetaine/carnitine-CoA ligase
MLDILMRAPAPSEGRGALRVAWGAGVGASVWNKVKGFFGVEVRECYGMTEGASFATVNGSDVPGSIGTALPWLTVEILDDEGNPVPTGKLGQIVVSSEIDGNFMPGYLNNPEASAQALREGKLYTGDMARMGSDGYLYFVGRRTDSMRVRGENVSAWEVERVFLEYEGIAAVAAIGVKSDVGEQEIVLYVQWDGRASPDFEKLSNWAKSRLASFQLPRYYKNIDHFERTPSERIRKHLLSRDTYDAWDCFRGTPR